MPRRVSSLMTLALGALLLFSGCSGSQSAPPGSGSGGKPATPPASQVIIGMSQEPDNLNPAISTLEVARSVQYAVLEPLWMMDEKGNFVPKLAAAVPGQNDVSADGKTYTIKLRSGVKWHDGQLFTSKDVKFTFELMQNPNVKIQRRNGFDLMTNLETPDDNTVRFTLKKPYAAMVTILADTFILPAHILGKSQDVNTDSFNAKPVGTGPFKFVEWQRGQFITVQANMDYWAGPPKLGKAIFKIVPDRKVLFTQLTTGEVDIIGDSLGISEEYFQQAKAVPNLQVENLTSNFYEHVLINLSNPILSDVKLRQALRYATDMKPILDTVLFGLHKQANTFIPMSNWAYFPEVKTYPYDLSKAKALLDAAGWQPGPDGIRTKGGQRLTLTIATTTGNAIRAQIEQLLQQQWKGAGIDLKIDNMAAATVFGDYMIQSKFALILIGQFVDPDPDLFSYPTFHSGQIPRETKQGRNWGVVKVPEIDRALEQGQGSVDPEQRKAAYRKIQEIYAEQVLDFPLYYKGKIFGWHKKVQGVRLNPNALTPAWNLFEWRVGS